MNNFKKIFILIILVSQLCTINACDEKKNDIPKDQLKKEVLDLLEKSYTFVFPDHENLGNLISEVITKINNNPKFNSKIAWQLINTLNNTLMKTIETEKEILENFNDSEISKILDPVHSALAITQQPPLLQVNTEHLNINTSAASNQNLKRNWGIAYDQGNLRPTMEDKHDIKTTPTHLYFGLFDGHGGDKVAEFLANNLYNNIINNADFQTDKTKAFEDSFTKTNNEIFKKFGNDAKFQGSTAVIALIEDNTLYVANVGDSRAVLSSNGNAIPLSNDHKPYRREEKERITNLGGQIKLFGSVWRINEGLSVSRAFGDKADSPYIIADPEITVHQITNNDDFLILACDGVWDVLSNQAVVDRVKRFLKENDDLDQAAKDLVNLALITGSDDNVSVIIIDLRNANSNYNDSNDDFDLR